LGLVCSFHPCFEANNNRFSNPAPRRGSGAAFAPCRSIADSFRALYECSARRREFEAFGKLG
jgi:hypothetical protein